MSRFAELPIVGRQWKSITVGEYAKQLARQTGDVTVLPVTESERRLIRFVVESWLEEWWKKNSQG